MRIIVCILSLLLTLAAPLRAADPGSGRLDTVPRVAVVSAFEPEWKVLKANLADAKSHSANGVEFVTGTMAGRKVEGCFPINLFYQRKRAGASA